MGQNRPFYANFRDRPLTNDLTVSTIPVVKALLYKKSIPRYLALRLLGRWWRGMSTSAASPVSLDEAPQPALPAPGWVRLRPRLAGICGSDIGAICARNSPYFSPLTSCPFVLGHEAVCTVGEPGPEARLPEGIAQGSRVVLQPALGCVVRGIDPPCACCARGDFALCGNVTQGLLSPGIQTGYCRDTGGAFADEFVAHPSQLFAVPDGMDDETAVLAEPFACALHAVIPSLGKGHRNVLVIGAGTIGLLTIAALRAMGYAGRILVAARHAHQRELAQALGADKTIPAPRSSKERYRELAAALDARVLPAELGKPTVIGGADAVFECVGASDSIADAMRFTAAGGEMVLVGMPGLPKSFDWSPAWYKELTVRGA